jgi:hypothetical protein
MLGKRKTQRDLFDVGNVFALELDPKSFHAQLAAAAPRLFSDADFAAFYADRTGRPSVPPSQLALLTLLQHEAGCSDQEAVDRSAFDLRWAAVLGKPAGPPLCAKSTFQLFRAHLVLHDAVLVIFQTSIQEARSAGLLGRGPLKIALDTKPILGRGAVLDTYNLLSQGIQNLIRALAQHQHQTPEAWAAVHDFSRYVGHSLKGSADLDWSDKEARTQFFAEIVTDARRLLRLAGEALGSEGAQAIRESAQLLEQLLLQDVVETKGEDGETRPSLRQGTAPGRIPSVTDPEQRHGRKSSSKRFNGHKGAIATDRDSQIILDATVLPGSAPDAEGALEQVERVEANTGQTVAESQGDCAYGGAATRQAFAEAGRELVAKVPQEASNGGRFPKSTFVLDVLGGAVTCLAGETTRAFTVEGDGGKLFRFGAVCSGCPLREQCTEAKEGRTVRMHPLEEELQAARAYQQSAEGRRHLRERVVVEHRLARLGQLGMGQARYVGRAKTRCQLLLLATIANLRRTWNWVAAQAGQSGGADGAESTTVCVRGRKQVMRTGNELGSPRGGGWRALWRLLQPLHRSVLTRAIGYSAVGFRLHF